jgi:hypothetical protein
LSRYVFKIFKLGYEMVYFVVIDDGICLLWLQEEKARLTVVLLEVGNLGFFH